MSIRASCRGSQLHADEFGIGQRQVGRLDAEVLADPLGLRLVSFESATDSFTAQGSGGWFVGDDGDTTRFAVGINSTNVGQMLTQLGFAPFVEAETAEVTASLYWPGPPSSSWLDHICGDLALRAEKGSLVDVAPGGAGRAAGLLSISALPRRLALDFRDVFNRGLVFDDITADFVIVDGNAYTDNLKLTGPVAEVGLIGRTGLRDRDYRQQAVVTAEPGKVLPTVGALLAGPQVAAALLIFTRIFKKPLGGIGRASYCVTGSWSEPTVERLTDEQLEEGAVCAELPPNAAATARGRGAMKVAAVQMTSTRDVAANLREAGRLVADAARQGAKLVVLPENFSFLGATDADRVAAVETFGDGPAQQFLAETAESLGLWIVGGTIPIRDAGRRSRVVALAARRARRPTSRRIRQDPSCSLLVGARRQSGGALRQDPSVRRRHPRPRSRALQRIGDDAARARASSRRARRVARIGMTVCYDIRFPALFHRLSVLGTDIVVVPAAFTVPTGEVHWLPLLQARAIESLVYVVAAGQWGEHAGGRKTYGHSLILGPWGELLAELPAGPGVVCADLDMIRLAELRQRFPTVSHRREL